MADYEGSEDGEESQGGIDVPELALGLSLIGLGAVLVFKALSHRGKGSPQLTHHIPIDITFIRQGNQVTGTVTLDSPDPDAPVSLTIGYAPAEYVVTPQYSCTAAKNSGTATFQFTVGTIPAGQCVNVKVCDLGYSVPPYCLTKPFPPPP